MTKKDKSYYLARQDLAAIENRDNAILLSYLDGNPVDSIKALAGRVGVTYVHLRRVVSLTSPLTEDLAEKINADLDLDLWGIPSRKGKRVKPRLKRKVVEYVVES